MSYKCVKCGLVKQQGSKAYVINNIESMLAEPTCSEKCAKEKIEDNMQTLINRLFAVRNTKITEEIWYD